MEQQSFADRIQTLKQIAEHLRSYAETIMTEAQRMEAVQSRMSARNEKRVYRPFPRR